MQTANNYKFWKKPYTPTVAKELAREHLPKNMPLETSFIGEETFRIHKQHDGLDPSRKGRNRRSAGPLSTQIAYDAMALLRRDGFATGGEDGYWIILDTPQKEEAYVTHKVNVDPPEKEDINNHQKDPINVEIIGEGSGSVYLYYYPMARENAKLKGESFWRCKIGFTNDDPYKRVDGQTKGTNIPEKPIIGLIIKTDKAQADEGLIHNVLKRRGKHIEDAGGQEFFLTSPSEVKEIYYTIDIVRLTIIEFLSGLVQSG